MILAKNDINLMNLPICMKNWYKRHLFQQIKNNFLITWYLIIGLEENEGQGSNLR